MDKFIFEEVTLEEVETLEDTVTPGLGLYCGNGCLGWYC
jgi:hypothetical protein